MSTPPEVRSPTHVLWDHLRRPFDLAEVVDAALGLPEETVDQLIGSRLATSVASERLLTRMPILSRALATTITTHPERCQGELRGPVLWSETMAARGASAGAPDVYVCSVPRRGYDMEENRVLVAALAAIRDAGRAASGLPADSYDDETLRHARANGTKAQRWLNSPQLSKVPITRPTGREVRRVRAGTRRSTYLPALRVLEEVYEPLTADDLLPYCDQRTVAQHRVLTGLVERFAARGEHLPHFRAASGALRSGPIEYHHPRVRGRRDGVHGILVGGVLVDVPDSVISSNRRVAAESLAARSGGRAVVVILDDGDIDHAVDLALRS
ncbi:MAG: hypothetical protein ACXIVQ_01490 [Acidimicrobiales bacterium]